MVTTGTVPPMDDPMRSASLSPEEEVPPLPEGACGVLALCELPKGHDGLHQTSVLRAAELDAAHGYLVFEGPNGEMMRTPYRAARTPRETPVLPDEIESRLSVALARVGDWRRFETSGAFAAALWPLLKEEMTR